MLLLAIPAACGPLPAMSGLWSAPCPPGQANLPEITSCAPRAHEAPRVAAPERAAPRCCAVGHLRRAGVHEAPPVDRLCRAEHGHLRVRGPAPGGPVRSDEGVIQHRQSEPAPTDCKSCRGPAAEVSRQTLSRRRVGSQGGQAVVHQARIYESLDQATIDCASRVGFHRWVGQGSPGEGGSRPRVAVGVDALIAREGDLPGAAVSATSRPPGAPKVALVFGREDTGLTDSDLRHCDTLCSLPCGRLCESLSLSHCVTAVLARLFEVRTAGTPTPGS